MEDIYKNYAELSANEVEGVDYTINIKQRKSDITIITPHGGSIESGSSELVIATSGTMYNYYTFDGIKPNNNASLHITSTNFDEPLALNLVASSRQVLSIHGAEGETPVTYVGGRDRALRNIVTQCLRKYGFIVQKSPSHITGESDSNFINKCQSGMGCQLELSTKQRQLFFENEDFTSKNRHNTTEIFDLYVQALQEALEIRFSRVVDKYTTLKMNFSGNLSTGKGVLQDNYVSKSVFEQSVEGFQTEVSKKVGKTEIVSTINQSAEAVKIKADKIQLEGLITNGVDGKRIEIQDEDYRALQGDTQKISMGFKNFGDYGSDTPAIYIGSNGMNYSQTNTNYDSDRYYLKLLDWGSDNPTNENSCYGELTYNTKYNDNNGKPAISNLRLKGDGDIHIAPIKDLDIRTSFKNGSLESGSVENLMARFTTTSLSLYNSHLQIGAIANHSNPQGLVLSDRYLADGWDGSSGSQNGDTYRTSVTIRTLSDGTRTFRPATTTGDIRNGTTSYPWYSVTAKNVVSSSSVVAEPVSVVANVPTDSVLDNINFISTYNDSEDDLVMDVTNILGTKYADISEEGTAYISNGDMITLLLMEVKKLKDEISELKQNK